MFINHTAAIIVTGGAPSNTAGTSVELLHSDGSPWCSLPDLPEYRLKHTQTGLEACGGCCKSAYSTCVRLEAGSWTQSHQLVEKKRLHHSSWASPAGTLLIGGGDDTFRDLETTELLDATTGDSVMSFPLKYDTW